MLKFLNPFNRLASKRQVEGLRNQLYDLKEFAMTAAQDTAARIDLQTARVQKIGTETRTLITTVNELKASLEGSGIVQPPEVIAALDKMDAQLAVVDDLVPDAAPGSTATESATGETSEEATASGVGEGGTSDPAAKS